MKTRLFLAFLLVLTAIAGVAWATAAEIAEPAETAAPAEAEAPAETGTENDAPSELPTLLVEPTEAGACCVADCFDEKVACQLECGQDQACRAACSQAYQACRSHC